MAPRTRALMNTGNIVVIALETLKGEQGYEKRIVDLAHEMIDCLIQNLGTL